MAEIIWKDLPKRLNSFTSRNATMRDLTNKKVVQYYSANTKIVLVQKAQVGNMTYYRTASARDRGLNWAFEASAFGLPNDIASLAPVPFNSLNPLKPVHTPTKPVTKQKPMTKTKRVSPKSEEEKTQKLLKPLKLISRLFRKKKG